MPLKKKKDAALGAVKKKLVAEQVADTLRDHLKDRGNSLFKLPSIAELSKQLGVSVVNVHKAVNLLETEGLVEVIHGKGVFTKPVATHVNDMRKGPAIGIVCHSEEVAMDYLTEGDGFYNELMRGATHTAGDHGYRVALHWMPSRIASNPAQWEAVVDFAKKNKVKGMLLLCLTNADLVAWIAERIKPCVLVDHWAEGVDIDTVNPDNYGAAYSCVAYLSKKGLKRIACFFHHRKSANPPRLEGYRNAMNELGGGYDEALMRYTELSEMAGKEAMLDLLEEGTEFDALITFGKAQAVGAGQVLRERHMKCEIMSFGESEMSGDKGILAVDLRPKAIGEMSVKRLLSRLKDAALPTENLLCPVCLLGEKVSVPAKG